MTDGGNGYAGCEKDDEQVWVESHLANKHYTITFSNLNESESFRKYFADFQTAKLQPVLD